MFLLLEGEEAWGYMSQTTPNEHLKTHPLLRSLMILWARRVQLGGSSAGCDVIWIWSPQCSRRWVHVHAPRAGTLSQVLPVTSVPAIPPFRVAGLLTCQHRAPTSMKAEATRPRTGTVSLPTYSLSNSFKTDSDSKGWKWIPLLNGGRRPRIFTQGGLSHLLSIHL